MTEQSFGKRNRIRAGADFDRAYARRVVVSDANLVVFTFANDSDQPRLGLSISRKVGNAVVRNRWKRTLREAFRRQKVQLPKGYDFVVIPRKGATCDYHALRDSLNRLTRRGVGRWKKQHRSS